jgi:NitT/TauT family transport system substrate-binding protein
MLGRLLRALPLLALAACGGRSGEHDPTRLRIGYLANVTHAPALTAQQRGTFAAALAPVEVEWRAFGAGPSVVEAIYAGAIDVAYLGPGPAEMGYLRSKGQALQIIAGAASGGAALVVRSGITSPSDLHHKKVADPQIGNTQDVALRTWLEKNDLRSTDRGGDVMVLPMGNPDIFNLFRRGDIDGAWVPEPWVTRLETEAGGRVLVDERDLWPDGRFLTTVLVATRDALRWKRDAVAKLLGAHIDEICWIRSHPAEARDATRLALDRIGGKKLPKALIDRSLDRIDFTWDPMEPVLMHLADDARHLRYLPRGDLAQLVDRSLLDEALAARGEK